MQVGSKSVIQQLWQNTEDKPLAEKPIKLLLKPIRSTTTDRLIECTKEAYGFTPYMKTEALITAVENW